MTPWVRAETARTPCIPTALQRSSRSSTPRPQRLYGTARQFSPLRCKAGLTAGCRLDVTARPVVYALLDRTRSSTDAMLSSTCCCSSLATGGVPCRRPSPTNINEPWPLARTSRHRSGSVGPAQMRKQQMGSTSQPRPIRTNENTIAGLVVAVRTFQDLTRRFPRDTAAVTGLGDAYRGRVPRLLSSPPFTARRYLHLALEQYNRAAELGRRPMTPTSVGAGADRSCSCPPCGRPAVPLVAGSPRPRSCAGGPAGGSAGSARLRRRGGRCSTSRPGGPGCIPDTCLVLPDALYRLGAVVDGCRLTGAARVSLVQVGGAGGTVQDLSLIPRTGMTDM